jgi:hypothetical protein
MWMGSQILWLRIGILEKEWEAQGAAANADKVRFSGTLVAKHLLAVPRLRYLHEDTAQQITAQGRRGGQRRGEHR